MISQNQQEKIEKYTKDISYKEFIQNTLLIDGVTRNLGIIGEAVKNIPAEIKRKYPNVEWKKIAGLRDIIIHEYSGINLEIIWDIVVNKVLELKNSAKKIIKDIKKKMTIQKNKEACSSDSEYSSNYCTSHF